VLSEGECDEGIEEDIVNGRDREKWNSNSEVSRKKQKVDQTNSSEKQQIQSKLIDGSGSSRRGRRGGGGDSMLNLSPP
jgi:hypothetical protein